MSNKQTAVEWLFDQMFDPTYPAGEQIEWLEQAKEMEKEQIINAFNIGDMFSADYFDGCSTSEAENYYNETYKDNK